MTNDDEWWTVNKWLGRATAVLLIVCILRAAVVREPINQLSYCHPRMNEAMNEAVANGIRDSQFWCFDVLIVILWFPRSQLSKGVHTYWYILYIHTIVVLYYIYENTQLLHQRFIFWYYDTYRRYRYRHNIATRYYLVTLSRLWFYVNIFAKTLTIQLRLGVRIRAYCL